jgi:hypothetical protein
MLPLDELHCEPRSAVAGEAAVHEPCDVGVLQTRQDLTLGFESPQDLVVVETALDQLEGHRLPERAVGALGAIDGAHAARTDPFLKAPRTDATSRHRVHRGTGGVDRFAKHLVGTTFGFEEGDDLGVEAWVVGSQAFQERATRFAC